MKEGINFKAPPGVEGTAQAGQLFNAVLLNELSAKEVAKQTDIITVNNGGKLTKVKKTCTYATNSPGVSLYQWVTTTNDG